MSVRYGNYALGELVNLYCDSTLNWEIRHLGGSDFMIQNKPGIVPMEIKAGRIAQACSLAKYRKKYDPRISAIASLKNTGGNRVPRYMLGKPERLIGK